MALFYTFANLLSLAPRKTAGFSHLLLHSGCCHVFFGLCLKKTQPRADVQWGTGALTDLPCRSQGPQWSPEHTWTTACLN